MKTKYSKIVRHLLKFNKIKINKSKSYVTKENMQIDFHCCPNCDYTNVINEDKYCPNCGIKLIWK